MTGISALWAAPLVNPVNNKALTIPVLNPINVYGRVFHFAWFGFFLAFWSWFAFPPLLSDAIAADVGMTKIDVANSNIVSLCATLVVRLVAGPCCDRFGPRWTFAGCLIAGAIPTFCAGGAYNTSGILAIRFFVGILGGSFVPCQVWMTGFFDKNTVGLANALAAGFGNAGGGVTYFVMPAIYNSLMRNQHDSRHVAWRVSFIVPGILIVFVAIAMLLCCPDTPTGKWADREQAVDQNLRRHSMLGHAAIPGELSVEPEKKVASDTADSSPTRSPADEKKDVLPGDPRFGDNEAHLTPEQMLDTAKGEVIRKPNAKEILHVFLSPQSFVTAACYFCSFGTELSVNSILGTYYMTNFKPALTLQEAGNWAAMFGLLNVVFRPIGGLVADFAYRKLNRSVWAKKALLHSFSLIMGVFLIVIGQIRTHDKSTLFGLIAGMAFFLEASNGMNYALVPHVHPFANGVISGLTGAAGNLGGIIFAIVFRYNGSNYPRAFWIIGVISICLNAAVAWIPPIPKGQIGGR